MKAVITVLGKDRTGIIASVSNLLYQHGVNILDITQTILSDMFTMIMAGEMNLEIRVQRSDIFDAMHRI